jgi:secondary thiamine-phosphate synthase enzyme
MLCFSSLVREIVGMAFQRQFEIATTGRGTTDITRKISETIAKSGVHTGLCHVFIHHTSASLIISENADPRVRVDLETLMARLAPDGDPAFIHDDEGPDDMPAHVRTVLTQTGLSIPVISGRSGLGTWQGVFLWEHRTHPHHRRVTVTVTE